MDERIASLDMLLRMAVAAVCAGAIGWERESRKKPAGLRTHMLVAIGAAGFTVVTLDLSVAMSQMANVQIDPTRVIAGIVGGIGFLGAGAIIESRGSVHGITTAAGLWVVGAVGVAAGMREFAAAAIIVGLCLGVLYPLGMLEAKTLGKKYLDQDQADAKR